LPVHRNKDGCAVDLSCEEALPLGAKSGNRTQGEFMCAVPRFAGSNPRHKPPCAADDGTSRHSSRRRRDFGVRFDPLVFAVISGTLNLLPTWAIAVDDAPKDSKATARPSAAIIETTIATDADENTVRRTRELIFFFRHHHAFTHEEEWAKTIRELIQIGKPAVPELVAELDGTERRNTISSLAFTLRAIGDNRAVPALIRAIPKTLLSGKYSDCGIRIRDPELRAFLWPHQHWISRVETEFFSYGRPGTEILASLERLTKHREPPPNVTGPNLLEVFLEGTDAEQARQRALYEERRRMWDAWWSEHWQDYLAAEELKSVELPKRDVDVVEAATVRRFERLFPTGPHVQLGLIQELSLDTDEVKRGRSCLDFETGQVVVYKKGMVTGKDAARYEDQRINDWMAANGLDLHATGGFVEGSALYSWRIDDQRWDTLATQILKNEPLLLGTEGMAYLRQNGDFEHFWTAEKMETRFFLTREGGRGIVQISPMNLESRQHRIRYRMWTNPTPKP